MRVLIATPVLGDAFGQERVVRTLCEGLERRGHEVFLVGEKRAGDLPPCVAWKAVPKLTSLHLFSPFAERAQALRSAKAFTREVNPDIVHFVDLFYPPWVRWVTANYKTVLTCHTVSATCPSSTRLLPGKPAPCTRKGGWGCLAGHRRDGCLSFLKSEAHRAHTIWHFLQKKKTLSKLNQLIAISHYVRSLLVDNGVPQEKIEVVYNPVPERNLVSSSQPEPLLLMLSRLVPLKGHAVFLEALNRISHLPWRAAVVGDGPLREPLLEQAKSLGLAGRVSFVGAVSFSQTQQFLSQAVALVQPNIGAEAFGMSVAEAASAGVPVVASRIPALDELIEDGVSGLLFTPGDAAQLAQQLEHVLAGGESVDRMRLLARERASRLFGEVAHLEKTIALYRKINPQTA